MTNSPTIVGKWYKVVICGVNSRIEEYPITKETPSVVRYLAPWQDPRELPSWLRFRANKTRSIIIGGIQYGQRTDKIKCTKHNWFKTEEEAKKYLQDYCYDKIKYHQNQINVYQELFNEF